MRYFLCALNTINVGIPAEQTERIIPVSRTQTSVYETGDQLSEGAAPDGAFISLPAMFQQKDTAVFHGLVLKNSKTILLMPKIDIDLEIPEDAIHSLPEAFVGVFSFFTGAYFGEEDLILIINPQKLVEAYHD